MPNNQCPTCKGSGYWNKSYMHPTEGWQAETTCVMCSGTGKRHEHNFIPCDEWSATCLCGATVDETGGDNAPLPKENQ